MQRSSIDKLFDLIRTLRGEGGCPWDRAQTVADILADLIDEAQELQWAEVQNSREEIFEETGDVLFVLAFAIALLQERDPSFTIERIADHAHEKIVRRHPHVFGDAVARTESESLAHWNRIKGEEERSKTAKRRTFSDIPGSLGPIQRAERMQMIAAEKGFDWPDVSGILDKIQEELDEVEERIRQGSTADIAEEIGDLFFSVVNLSRFLKIDSQTALARANAKFLSRYSAMEEFARRDGRNLADLTLEEMDRYWEKTKKKRGDPPAG